MRRGERANYVMIGLIIAIGVIVVRVTLVFREPQSLADYGILDWLMAGIEWLMVGLLAICACLCFWRMRKGERVIYGIVGLIIVTGTILVFVNPDFLETHYLAEDGILEWFTVAVFVFCAGLCFRRVLQLRSHRPAIFLLSVTFIGCAYIFGIGEELSWGQRIFGIETPEWLEERNKQQELNIHNLMVGDISVNKVVFGKILTVMLASYLFLLPWLAGRSPRVRGLVERFGLPLPTWTQALAFLPALILPDLLVPSGESDELREACGCLMLVILFCYPRNGYIYSPDWKVGEEPARPA